MNLPSLNMSMFTRLLHTEIRIKLRVYSSVDFSNNPRNLVIWAGDEVVSTIRRKSAECVEDKWTMYYSTATGNNYCYLDLETSTYHSENIIELFFFATDLNVTGTKLFFGFNEVTISVLSYSVNQKLFLGPPQARYFTLLMEQPDPDIHSSFIIENLRLFKSMGSEYELL